MSDETELPKLTDKQLNFVLGIQKGLSQSDAYRQAYNCERTASTSVWVRASELTRNSKVSLWLDHIKAQSVTTALLTKEQHLKDLAEAARLCKEKGAYSSMVKSIELQGKANDLYTSHIESTITSKADTDLLDQIEKSLGTPARVEAERRLGIKELH